MRIFLSACYYFQLYCLGLLLADASGASCRCVYFTLRVKPTHFTPSKSLIKTSDQSYELFVDCDTSLGTWNHLLTRNSLLVAIPQLPQGKHFFFSSARSAVIIFVKKHVRDMMVGFCCLLRAGVRWHSAARSAGSSRSSTTSAWSIPAP
jgi:hypothetical protein